MNEDTHAPAFLGNLEKLGIVDSYKKKMFDDTMYYQKKLKFNTDPNPKYATWNNEGDAFKHAYMQAYGVLQGGEFLTKLLSNIHEDNGNRYYGQPYKEENMDLWNNAVGRELGKSIKEELKDIKNFYNDRQIKDITAVKVMEKMKNGELITSPDDKRLYEHSRFNNRLYTLDDIDNMDRDEYRIHEKDIKTQLSNGEEFPSEQEAHEMVLKGRLQYIEPRKLNDGNVIKGYFRKK